MAKKIFALVASVVLVVCFAISVSAADITTTTTYVVGGDVEVNVKVDVAEGTNVTYYATKGAEKVYVNQEKATATGAEFNFVTDLANVDSDVKVGYTADETADEGEIPVPTFTVSGEGFEAVTVEAGTTTVAFDYSFVKFYELDNVVVLAGEAAIADASYADGKITVVFSRLEGDVTLAVNAKEVEINETAIEFDIIDAAAVVVVANGAYDEGIKIDAVKADLEENTPDSEDAALIESANADKAGDRKLTVCGKVVGEVEEYGIIVSEEEIAEENLRADAFAKYADKKYLGATKAPNGKFAIQLIDTSVVGGEGTPFVVAGTSYYTAVYVYDAATEAYYVVPFATAVAAN